MRMTGLHVKIYKKKKKKLYPYIEPTEQTKIFKWIKNNKFQIT